MEEKEILTKLTELTKNREINWYRHADYYETPFVNGNLIHFSLSSSDQEGPQIYILSFVNEQGVDYKYYYSFLNDSEEYALYSHLYEAILKIAEIDFDSDTKQYFSRFIKESS